MFAGLSACATVRAKVIEVVIEMIGGKGKWR